MGCIAQKQNRNQQRNQQRNTFQQHRQSLFNLNPHKKMCIEFPLGSDPKQQIQFFREIDVLNEQEFILKRNKKFFSKNQESPTSTPKFNQNLQIGIGNRSYNIIT